MPAKLRAGIIAICDAVYKDEASNKIVIAGLYSGNIVIDASELDLRFALYADFYLADSEPHDLDIQFWVERHQIGGARSQVVANDPSMPIAIMLPQFGLGMERVALPATLRVKAILDQGRPLIVLEKQILPRSVPSAARQPSERSRPAPRRKASKP